MQFLFFAMLTVQTQADAYGGRVQDWRHTHVDC